MKLLVIDDEKIVLDAAVHMLSQSFPEISVETARNGKEGLLKLEAHRPELVLTDIRMPGMSGLDFIREARRVDEQVHIVIVTAFDQFDYAREAFKYRVDDYVLKPLTRQKLKEVVERALQTIAATKERRYQELESIDRLYRAMQMVENNFFFSLLQWSDLSGQLEGFRDLLGLGLEEGYLLGVEAVPLPKEASWQQTNAYYNRLGDACSELRNRLKFAGGGLVCDPMGQRFYGYVEGMDQQSLQGLLESAYQEILKRYGIKTKVVYSGLAPAAAWPEVLRRLQLALGISERNVESLELVALPQGQRQLQGHWQAQPQMMAEGLTAHGQKAHGDALDLSEASGPAKLARAASDYLKDHMTEEISLEGVALSMHVTPPYLSKIFKEQLGTTFSAYLTELRIAAAKSLLLARGLSVKEVGLAVGYQDPNYFVRLFKKVTGYTPSEYQKVMS